MGTTERADERFPDPTETDPATGSGTDPATDSDSDSAGGFTTVPRWTRAPLPGTAEYRAVIPDALLAALDHLADHLGVSPASVLTAAHLKVLGALSGESEVVGACVTVPGGAPRPCRLALTTDSWRTLVLDVHRALSALPGPPAGRREPSVDSAGSTTPGPHLPGSAPVVVFDPYGEGDGPADRPDGGGPALRMSVTHREDGRRAWRLRHRTDAYDEDFAARIVGYHRTALERLTADPDAAPGPQSLLGAAERHHQIEELAGPRRDLPELRAHEVFAQQARAHPNAVAVVRGGRQWTYGELDARANRLARALLAQGLRPEDVVAVVGERDLGWTAAVLGVLKAGGVYLPVEPRFPAERVAAMLGRAACRFALVGPGDTDPLDRALASMPEVRVLPVEAADDESLDATDPGVHVPPESAAYIYFTSGSTGEPKGALCEHAGLLNHLYAKIDDLGIDRGTVVAQSAPQCFDISLWQLLAALLTGGRTLLVEQEAVLDVPRFLDTLVLGRVNVLQVVPSYLEAVLSCLERAPRELPDLRRVCVTGEAVKRELVQRWFATGPGVRLVNAYGLTETSDDTNHHVMDRAPDSARVPLGRPVNNVRVYVVDADLSPVPLGAPGEIVLSGVCVGRGYVNDPERTRLAFGRDPHRPGNRLYRSGDHGRWLPDGALEFLGRRDHQVKIRGFRIEVDEIDNALLRVPGIRDGAVVAAGRPGRGRYLAAFYTGRGPLAAADVRDRLSARLPAYMVPSVIQWRPDLPLTPNGKIDKRALIALASARDPAVEDRHRPPGTPTERRIAAAWAGAMGIPAERIGRQDGFFDLGGTSLAALRVAVSLDRTISLKDLTRHPVLADLARLVESRTARPDPPAERRPDAIDRRIR
ncbi:amino acid adenylation domain-containing protein [Streptomyces sp. NPDC093093]|uniref:amino acid adenylation domain-containing protein n=1 Tax=Streptomyces sp. NPDC093093 TaxID=3366025 RepID=UPI003827B3AB